MAQGVLSRRRLYALWCPYHVRMDAVMTGSENSNASFLIGECCCRAVRYEIADAFSYAMNCHCSNCRRTTGAAFEPFAGIEQGKLRIVRGENQLTIYGDETTHDATAPAAARCFIPGCATENGSTSPWEPWSMPPRSDRAPTFSWARRRPGTRLRIICLNIGATSGMPEGTCCAPVWRRIAAGLARRTKGSFGLPPAPSS
jgi:hypothetical protein